VDCPVGGHCKFTHKHGKAIGHCVGGSSRVNKKQY
jgi:hypothetical protein